MNKIITLDRFETHDRLKHLKKQDFDIGACCQNLIDKRPFGDHSFYIFAHTRTEDDGITKRLIWQPRLTKPKSQTNSMLFKAYPGKEDVKVIWMIPAREMWSQYQEGKLTASPVVMDSIRDFQNNREWLDRKEDDDLDDESIDAIYRQISAVCKPKPFRKI
jgi:hypothetical protein